MTLRSPSLSPDWRYPLLIERTVAADLPIRLREGSEVVTPTSGNVKIYRQVPDLTNPTTGLYYSGAVTPGATSLLAVPAVAVSEPLSSGWVGLWSMVMAGGLINIFRCQIFLVGQIPYPRVADEDVWGGDGVPELRLTQRRPQGQTDWAPQVNAAWLEIMRALTGEGAQPWQTIDTSDLYEWHLSLAVAKACATVPSDDVGYFARKAREYTDRAGRAGAGLKLSYEVLPTIRRTSTRSVVPCAPVGRPRW